MSHDDDWNSMQLIFIFTFSFRSLICCRQQRLLNLKEKKLGKLDFLVFFSFLKKKFLLGFCYFH